MVLGRDPGSAIRIASVYLSWAFITFSYYSFSHFVHHRHFNFQPQHDEANDEHGHVEEHGHGRRDLADDQQSAHEQHDAQRHSQSGGHGRQGDFDKFHLSHDKLFFYGLAVPLVLLTVAGLVWTPNSSSGTTKKGFLAKWFNIKSQGDVNVKKWTLILYLVPLIFVMLEGARGHSVIHASPAQKLRGSNLYIRICMSLMSPSGYAATWALALFLIPVTKHSPILDWLRVTPIQALAFHRIAGWTGFWNSILHGFLHLRHLMDVLNKRRERTNMEQLKYLIIPDSWSKCLVTQNPWHVFRGYQDPYPEFVDGAVDEQAANQCWLALVNFTGVVSCVAFALLALTSLEPFRRKFYTLFFIVHIPSAWIMLVMAIWHYPTCGLILIPNIVYYFSLNVPVWVTQSVERWAHWWKQNQQSEVSASGSKAKVGKSSALVEANLIQGGSIELTFAMTPQENRRHENCYVRVYCPGVSSVYHPFSIFSGDDLTKNAGGIDGSSLTTASILLRSKGPFTQGLLKQLKFEALADSPSNSTEGDAECPIVLTPDPQVEDTSSQVASAYSPSDHEMQFDSYYAGSFDWVDSAMSPHDQILIIAGGVGIVPFLEFLPALQRKMEADHLTNNGCGPDSIHLHWYCRETGLASYIWDKYLHPHVRGAWENSVACQGRLKIHLHLTALKHPSSHLIDEEGGVDNMLASVPNSGLVEKLAYCDNDRHSQQQDPTIRPVQDARFTQSLTLRLLLPGFFMTVGILLNWWWYEQFIVADQFRRNNLIIRSHGIVFSLVLALIVSVLVELYYLRQNNAGTGYEVLGQEKEHKYGEQETSVGNVAMETAVPLKAKIVEFRNSGNYESTTSSSSSSDKSGESDDSMGNDSNSDSADYLEVTGGRPPIDSVIENILKAEHPGVYSCGPRALLETVEGSIREKRNDCAFYQEDPEM